MSKLSPHPSREELSAYSLGQLPEERAVAIDTHISECGPCCETIVELSSEDTFAGLLQEVGRLQPDQTLESDMVPAESAWSPEDIPPPLAEHPRYEIVRLLGKGGMGNVYEARHRMMDRSVALKIIKREFVRKPEAVDRFHREVKAAAQLAHPNVVTAHDAEQAGDIHFMVMEFVDGIDLSEMIKDQGALPVADACDYVRQAAIGLQHAHERGMVHRDIKPHNLMVTANGTVKILDFGLASLSPETTANSDVVEARSDLTAAGAIMGTPDFISPEQAEDARRADIRSDIYSLGATLYYLLSGRVPFADGSVMHKLKSHAQVEPDSLNSLRDDLPAELVAIVTKMMAKEPDERFQTPAAVADALKTIAKNIQFNKPAESSLQVQSDRLRNRWLPLTAVATILFAAIIASIVYYIQTDNGIVRVEVADETLAVEINGQTVTMEAGDNHPIVIRTGEKKLHVRELGTGFEFETDNFQIQRNGETTFKVDLIAGEIVVIKDGQPFDRAKLSLVDRVSVANGNDGPAGDTMLEVAHAYTPFNYDLSLVPSEVMSVYGYRPHQIRKDGRFTKVLESLDQSGSNTFLMDENLDQVLTLHWANEDRSYSQPIFILTVIDGTATDFAKQKLGIAISDPPSEQHQWTYYAVEFDNGIPMPEEQFVRFVDDKRMIVSSKDFLDAHQVALKARPHDDLMSIASTIPDGELWIIGNTTDKEFVDEIMMRFGASPLAAVLMTQTPLWEETSHLAISLSLGDLPKLHLSAHALSSDQQKAITQAARVVPVALANLLRASSDRRGPVSADTIGAIINALNGATITEPSNTETRISVSLKESEPHLFHTLNAYFDPVEIKRRAFKAASVSNLRQIGMAIMFFEQEHGYLPSVKTKLPGAMHPVSWRVAILKYLDESLYEQYRLDQPWDSDHNKALIEKMPDFYRHPGQEEGMTETCYITLAGEETATGDGTATVKMLEDITDGPHQTIMITEGLTRIPWTKPEDVLFGSETMLPEQHPDPDGWNVIFVDGSAHFIPSETPTDVLKALITRNGGERIENANSTWKKSDSASPVESPANPQAVSPE